MVEMFPLKSADAAYNKISGMVSSLGDPFTRIISPKVLRAPNSQMFISYIFSDRYAALFITFYIALRCVNVRGNCFKRTTRTSELVVMETCKVLGCLSMWNQLQDIW